MRADLHIHSTASDGTLTPEQLVALASKNRIDVIALCDHDSVSGVSTAMRAGLALGVSVVPAVELSSVSGDSSVHILGYFIDIEDPALGEALASLTAARRRRARCIVEALVDAGYDITMDAVLSLSDGGAVGRTHVARALVAAGYARDVSDAFSRFVGRGSPFYRSKSHMSPEAAISLIRAAGGLAVLAHPGSSGTVHMISSLVDAGLRGVEAYHADHSESQSRELSQLAGAHGLVVTGGTDYHSPGGPHPELGDTALPSSCVRAFLETGAAIDSERGAGD